ncbi:mitochondrial ribosomal subunit S27-domain-containing protein [Camillea tinctor]|nr:mitochondrial ribosomal subunit S27-domain-containing protein [Camillea tinctor]
MSGVPRARMLDLMKVQCQIFATTYNPDGIRMGNKVLRQRLRGPTLAKYYPPRGPSVNDLQRVRSRGKGAPKKKRTAPAAPEKKSK